MANKLPLSTHTIHSRTNDTKQTKGEIKWKCVTNGQTWPAPAIHSDSNSDSDSDSDPETETDWDSDGDETSVGPCDKLSNIRNLRKRRTTVAIH